MPKSLHKNLVRLGASVDKKSLTDFERELDEKITEDKSLHELGTQFLADKESIENRIEALRARNNPDYAPIIEQLEQLLSDVQKQYEEDVAEKREELAQQTDDLITDIYDVGSDIQDDADDIRRMEMQASSSDTRAAADAGDQKAQDYHNVATDHALKLKLLMEQQADINRKMRVRRLRGE